MTPLRRLTGWNAAIRFRRMLGLFAFFYGTLHCSPIVVADRFAGLDFPNGIVAWQTVAPCCSRSAPRLYVGRSSPSDSPAWVCMVPLAVTSTAGMIRRLGGRRWQMLHRLIYVSAVAGVVHYWWLVKADIRRPEAYAVVVGALLAFRVLWAMRTRAPVPARPVPGQASQLLRQSTDTCRQGGILIPRKRITA